MDGSSTLLQVFNGVCDGFLLDAEYNKSLVKSLVGASTKGEFQDVPITEKVDDCIEFGKYFKYCLQTAAVATEKAAIPNAFEILMQSSRQKCLP